MSMAFSRGEYWSGLPFLIPHSLLFHHDALSLLPLCDPLLGS